MPIGADDGDIHFVVALHHSPRVTSTTSGGDIDAQHAGSERYGRRMPIDVVAARAATPGCQDLIHLNNAGAALPTQTVLDTQLDYLQLEAQIGGYEAHAHEKTRIDAIRPTIARLIGADPTGDEIALAANNTAAFDLFLSSWAISPTHA